MSITPNAHAARLKRFFEAGARHAFLLVDGTHCEGYALEIEPDRVLFASGGPLAPPESVWLPYDRIAPARLAYYDDSLRRWVEFGA